MGCRPLDFCGKQQSRSNINTLSPNLTLTDISSPVPTALTPRTIRARLAPGSSTKASTTSNHLPNTLSLRDDNVLSHPRAQVGLIRFIVPSQKGHVLMEFGQNSTYANTDIVVNDTDLNHSCFRRPDHVLALPAVKKVVRGKDFPAVLGSFSGSMMLPARCHDEPRQGPYGTVGGEHPPKS